MALHVVGILFALYGVALMAVLALCVAARRGDEAHLELFDFRVSRLGGEAPPAGAAPASPPVRS